MITIATMVVNYCNDYVNDSWDRLLIYLRMDSTCWSLDFFQIFSIWKPCCYTCAVLLKSPNWASQQTRANGLVILKPNSKPENVKCRFKMNIWHNLPRYILSLGHPLFFFSFSVECVSWYWVGRWDWKKIPKKKSQKSRNRTPWCPMMTLKVNIHIFGLTKCTIYCKKCSCFSSCFSLCCYYAQFSD